MRIRWTAGLRFLHPLLSELRGHGKGSRAGNGKPGASGGVAGLENPSCIRRRRDAERNEVAKMRPLPALLYFSSIRITLSHYIRDLPRMLLPRLHRFFHPRLAFRFRVPTVLFICGTGISTCYPSTTSFALALGPDLPRADQLYSGNLRYSA